MRGFLRRFVKTAFNMLSQIVALEAGGFAAFLLTILVLSLDWAVIIKITLIVILWMLFFIIMYKIIKKSPLDDK
jgi:hypothetical protein